MVHLRILAPEESAEQALELLNDSKSVCNLVYLQGAARRPKGDVILCDIARDDVSVVIADLRELDIDETGSIAIEEIDSEISRAATLAEQHSGWLAADPVVWEELDSRTSESTELSVSFLAFMVLAMLIAAVGIYFNQPILIVAAMVVGPEFGPISGFCVALVNREPQLARRSLRALVIGFPLGTVVTLGATLLLKAIGELPDDINFDAHTLTRFIADPDFFSIYIAVLAGTVGMISLTSPKSTALVGVLISVTTIPAAANMGVAAAYEDWETVWGATIQLTVNLFGIFAAGLATLYIQRLIYVRRRHAHIGDESRRRAGLPVGSSKRTKTPAEEVDAL